MRTSRLLALVGMCCVIAPGIARADDRVPAAFLHKVVALDQVEQVSAPSVDLAAAEQEDQQRETQGLAPRFAIPNEVLITPATDGTWENLDDGSHMWRLRVTSLGALSLNLGFTRYQMPAGGTMFIYSADHNNVIGPFTADDNETHGELWTPVILADDIIVEVTLPQTIRTDELDLELARINVGYRFFGEEQGLRSGACNVDVVCPEGDAWRDEIPAIGVISTGGSLFCSGFMVNNTAEDETPYFMTAHHCSITSGNAASLVVYWNYESPTCGQHGGGSLSEWQSGSYFRATYTPSDFTLVELDDDPNPDWGITFAGWDHSSADATSACGIHHPNCDEKSISFEYQPTTTTSYLGTATPGDGSHVRITDWDVGTTEPGSSGSPLFNQSHHVIGQLHGGYAACGNDSSDWYGRFSMSWTGGGSSSTRLSDWLDPGNTGVTSLDTYVPGRGLGVTPETNLMLNGPIAGPFSPASSDFTLENMSDTGIDYSVTATASWLTVVNGAGSLGPNATTTVSIDVNSNALTLPEGNYSDMISFVNTTDHAGDTTRIVSLRVGGPAWDPVAYDDSVMTPMNLATSMTFSASDPNGDSLTYEIDSLPASGYLIDPNGGIIIEAGDLPYTLAGGADMVTYQPPCGVDYVDSFTFRAWDASAASNVATITLNVTALAPHVVHSFPLDSDPGWATEGNWAFGPPTGGGTHSRDPSSGNTGLYVYGYNLAGDYAQSMPVYALTTTAIDCANLSSTELRFYRWLGVESYDTASVEVSNDDTNWTQIWENPSNVSISDDHWTQQSYDISAVADGQSTVYIRWNMGPTDNTVSYPGWNIDDVEIWGVVPMTPTDFTGDGFVNVQDYEVFESCLAGPTGGQGAGCLCVDLDADGDIDLRDFADFAASISTE